MLGAISQPPYWGVKLEIVGAGIYSMGLPINSDAQVLTRDGDPVPGLYASGNTAAYTEILHGLTRAGSRISAASPTAIWPRPMPRQWRQLSSAQCGVLSGYQV